MTFGEIVEVFKNPELKCSLCEAYNGREEEDGDSTEILASKIPEASRETRPKSGSLSIGGAHY